VRVLVVGATGYIGRPVVEALAAAGHQAVALSRSAGSDIALRTIAQDTWSIALAEVGLLASVAQGVDACIFAPGLRTAGAEAVEASALRAIGMALPTGAPLLYVSGSTAYRQTDPSPARETDPVVDNAKTRLESLVFSFDAIMPMVVRPGLVTGRLGGVTSRLRDAASRLGRLPRIGPVDRMWSTVDVDDLAQLCLRMIERPAPNLILNAAGAKPDLLSGIFAACAAAAGVALDAGPSDMAILIEEIGPVAMLLDRDAVISPDAARAFGWMRWMA
jgi:nucleoside-diphosphate-sugar epimerase